MENLINDDLDLSSSDNETDSDSDNEANNDESNILLKINTVF